MNPLELQMLVLLSGVPEVSGTVLSHEATRKAEPGLDVAGLAAAGTHVVRVTGVSGPGPRSLTTR